MCANTSSIDAQKGNERTISSSSFVLSMIRSVILPIAQHCVAIRFDSDGMALICQPEGSQETLRLPVQGGTYAELMGELAALQALPIYQLALPFSLEAWRQLEYAHNLIGTTW